MKLEVGDFVKVINLKDTGISEKSVALNSYGYITEIQDGFELNYVVNINSYLWSFSAKNIIYVDI